MRSALSVNETMIRRRSWELFGSIVWLMRLFGHDLEGKNGIN